MNSPEVEELTRKLDESLPPATKDPLDDSVDSMKEKEEQLKAQENTAKTDTALPAWVEAVDVSGPEPVVTVVPGVEKEDLDIKDYDTSVGITCAGREGTLSFPGACTPRFFLTPSWNGFSSVSNLTKTLF